MRIVIGRSGRRSTYWKCRLWKTSPSMSPLISLSMAHAKRAAPMPSFSSSRRFTGHSSGHRLSSLPFLPGTSADRFRTRQPLSIRVSYRSPSAQRVPTTMATPSGARHGKRVCQNQSSTLAIWSRVAVFSASRMSSQCRMSNRLETIWPPTPCEYRLAYWDPCQRLPRRSHSESVHLASLIRLPKTLW
jgi:hypothetical protein